MKVYQCQYCGKEFEDHRALGGHTRGCKKRVRRRVAAIADEHKPWDQDETADILRRLLGIIEENRRLQKLVNKWTTIAGQIEEQLDNKQRG